MVNLTELVSRVSACLRSGLLSTAHASAGEALAVTLDDGRVWEIAGLLNHAGQQLGACLSKLETAMMLVPLRPAAWCALADASLQADRDEDARDLYAYVASLPGVSVDLLRYCASRLDAMDDSARALDVARRVVAMQGDSAQAVYEFGYYLARNGVASQLVISVMKRAVSLAPEQAIYRVGLAKMLSEWGDNSSALTWVRGFSARQLDQITCPCCLERLALLFESGHDPVRAHACRVRCEKRSAEPSPLAVFSSRLLIKEYLADGECVANSNRERIDAQNVSFHEN
jgi:hypothetical protein